MPKKRSDGVVSMGNGQNALNSPSSHRGPESAPRAPVAVSRRASLESLHSGGNPWRRAASRTVSRSRLRKNSKQSSRKRLGFVSKSAARFWLHTARVALHQIAQPMSQLGHQCRFERPLGMSASLIGHSRSSAFRLSAAAASMSLTGSCFSSESAPRPFHHGIRGRGGTIFSAALPSDRRRVQADMRTHLIHRPARDIFPPLGGSRVSSYWIGCCTVFMLLRLVPGSSGTRCRQPICGA
jgi:hypothetical protein